MASEIGQVGQDTVVAGGSLAAAVVVLGVDVPAVPGSALPAVQDVPAAVPQEDWEVALADAAARRLAGALPEASSSELKAELLAVLRRQHLARLKQNLNHWSAHAPVFLAQEVQRRLDAETVRQEQATAFMESPRHDEALVFALTFLEDREESEEVVAEADLKLWAGETSPRYYFRKLKQLILDKLKRRSKTRELFDSVEDLARRKLKRTSDLWENLNVLSVSEEEPSGLAKSADPIGRLLKEAAIEDAIRIVKTDRRRRGVRSREWWLDLMKYREVSRK